MPGVRLTWSVYHALDGPSHPLAWITDKPPGHSGGGGGQIEKMGDLTVLALNVTAFFPHPSCSAERVQIVQVLDKSTHC